MMKKIIQTPESVVMDMLEGIALAHPELDVLPKYKIVKRGITSGDKVRLISGGGSGHEPSHAGLVGEGMLDAAVCGEVFASPSQIQVYHAIKSVAGDKGVLLIIKNYSGDVMNFKNAAYLAQEDGLDVDFVRVDDDIAVEDSLYTVGRRGVGGTIFVHKIAGAAAEEGKSLTEVKRIAEKVIANVRTIGFALTSCTTPAKGSPTFELGEDEMEYGVGIHGEPGVSREKVTDVERLASRMVSAIADELELCGTNAKIAVLVNGFGGTPLMELYVLNKYASKELLEKGNTIVREFVGSYMTSIDMAGASLSVLKLDDELEDLLNKPANTPAMKVNGPVSVSIPLTMSTTSDMVIDFGIITPDTSRNVGKSLSYENIVFIVDAMSACAIRNEALFCEVDSFAGDGDFGMSIANGFRQLKREWGTIITQPDSNIGSFLEVCALILMENCGGASGPLWGSAFRAAGKSTQGKSEISIEEVASMLQTVVKAIQNTGERSFGRGAVVGDKTLIDALVPCADAWSNANSGDGFEETFKKAAAAAASGAKSTENIAAKMGRAATVGDRSIGHPDAGAYALGVIFTEISDVLTFQSQ